MERGDGQRKPLDAESNERHRNAAVIEHSRPVADLLLPAAANVALKRSHLFKRPRSNIRDSNPGSAATARWGKFSCHDTPNLSLSQPKRLLICAKRHEHGAAFRQSCEQLFDLRGELAAEKKRNRRRKSTVVLHDAVGAAHDCPANERTAFITTPSGPGPPGP